MHRKHLIDCVMLNYSKYYPIEIYIYTFEKAMKKQMTQSTSGETVTAVTDCCANCVETSRPQQWGPDLSFFGQAGEADTLLLIKAGDVETNPSPATRNKQVWICDICHKQIHGRKKISMMFYMIEHWEHLKCAGIRLAQYTDTWTCHQYK